MKTLKRSPYQQAILRVAFATCALCSATSGWCAPVVNLVQNGSFETADLSGWGGFSNALVSSASGASNGQYAAVLGDGSGFVIRRLDQSVHTVAGQAYTLGFDWLFGDAPSFQALLVFVTGNASDLLNRPGPSGVFSVGRTAEQFAHYDFQFTADSALTNLTFIPQAIRSAISGVAVPVDQLIDNVSVQTFFNVPVDPVSGNSVPEPGTLTLLAAGLAFAVTARHRQRHVAA